MASGSGDGSNEPILHLVWRKLPVELIEVVLTRVPFESLTCFRAVCKRFNPLITSSKFARECQRQQAWKPVPMMVRKSIPLDSCSVDVLNTETNSWVTSPLPVLEARLYPLMLCADSGGLLCFDTADFGKLLVCNPLMGAFRLLEIPNPPDGDDGLSPKALYFHRAITGLAVDLQKGTFTLVLVTSIENEGKRKTFLYDSADGSWRSGAPLPDIMGYFFHTLTCNGNIFVLVKRSTLSGSYKLLKYHVRDDKWNVHCLPLSDFQMQHPKIFFRERVPPTRHEETLVTEMVQFKTLHKNLVRSCHGWIEKTSDVVVTTAIRNVICVPRCPFRGYPLQVLHFSSTTNKSSFLPDCLKTKTRNWAHDEFEFKLLEPSLTVDL